VKLSGSKFLKQRFKPVWVANQVQLGKLGRPRRNTADSADHLKHFSASAHLWASSPFFTSHGPTWYLRNSRQLRFSALCSLASPSREKMSFMSSLVFGSPQTPLKKVFHMSNSLELMACASNSLSTLITDARGSALETTAWAARREKIAICLPGTNEGTSERTNEQSASEQVSR